MNMKRAKWLVMLLTVFLLLTAAGAAGAETVPWTCPNCGAKGNTGNFCPSCAHPSPAPGSWTCPNCGTAGNIGKFCPACGHASPAPLPASTPAPAQSSGQGPAAAVSGGPVHYDDGIFAFDAVTDSIITQGLHDGVLEVTVSMPQTQMYKDWAASQEEFSNYGDPITILVLRAVPRNSSLWQYYEMSGSTAQDLAASLSNSYNLRNPDTPCRMYGPAHFLNSMCYWVSIPRSDWAPCDYLEQFVEFTDDYILWVSSFYYYNEASYMPLYHAIEDTLTIAEPDSSVFAQSPVPGVEDWLKHWTLSGNGHTADAWISQDSGGEMYLDLVVDGRYELRGPLESNYGTNLDFTAEELGCTFTLNRANHTLIMSDCYSDVEYLNAWLEACAYRLTFVSQ